MPNCSRCGEPCLSIYLRPHPALPGGFCRHCLDFLAQAQISTCGRCQEPTAVADLVFPPAGYVQNTRVCPRCWQILEADPIRVRLAIPGQPAETATRE